MFLWNRLFLTKFLASPDTTTETEIKFLNPYLDQICTRIINGSLRMKQVYVGVEAVTCLLISRLSLNRVGTRYKTRGIDDYGNVANFVETNQVLFYGVQGQGNQRESKISSFTQIRGSIPVYWAQPGLNAGAHKIYFTRKNPLDLNDCQVNKFAAKKHFDLLEKLYPNKSFVALNLVKQTPGGEREISNEFVRCLAEEGQRVKHIALDLHAHKNRDLGMEQLIHNHSELIDATNVIVRTNCIDCLDRTNGAQKIIGLKVLELKQLPSLSIVEKNRFASFLAEFKRMWLENGDNLSVIYAGTAAMGTGSKMTELHKSVTRTLRNNFMDGDKEYVMKILSGAQNEDTKMSVSSNNYNNNGHIGIPPFTRMLLGNTFESNDYQKLKILKNNVEKFSNDRKLRIAIGSFNVNALEEFNQLKVEDWLNWHNLDSSKKFENYVALYDFQQVNEADLGFVAGDVLKVLVNPGNASSEWLSGTNTRTNQSGIFPRNYTKLKLKTYKAIYDFSGQTQADLTFLTSDEIVPTNKDGGEWWEGYRLEDPEQRIGTFPASYVMSNDLETVDLSDSPDLIVLGFQEICDLSAQNIYQSGDDNAKNWLRKFTQHFEASGEYVFVTQDQLVGIALFVFVRKHLVPQMKDVGIAKVRTGAGGYAGNKGAVCATITIYSTSICFICAHLAAGEKNVVNRNNDVSEIARKLKFDNIYHLNNDSNNLNIENEHEYVFWLGDFNYRIDLSKNEAESTILQEDWCKLQSHCQLLQQRKKEAVFKGFYEGELNFKPTYKYDKNTDVYDTSDKQRVPSWTDRILWKRDTRYNQRSLRLSKPFSHGRILHYAPGNIKLSDHRPILAIFDLDVVDIDHNMKREFLNREYINFCRAEEKNIILPNFNPINPAAMIQRQHSSPTNSIRPIAAAVNSNNSPEENNPRRTTKGPARPPPPRRPPPPNFNNKTATLPALMPASAILAPSRPSEMPVRNANSLPRSQPMVPVPTRSNSMQQPMQPVACQPQAPVRAIQANSVGNAATNGVVTPKPVQPLIPTRTVSNTPIIPQRSSRGPSPLAPSPANSNTTMLSPQNSFPNSFSTNFNTEPSTLSNPFAQVGESSGVTPMIPVRKSSKENNNMDPWS